MQHRKNFIGTIICIALLTLILSILCGCSPIDNLLFGKPDHGPYHHAAPVVTPTKVISVQDKQYCILYNKVFLLQNGGFKLVSTRTTNDPTYISVQDIQTDGEKLFVCGKYSLPNGIVMFSSDYEYEEMIYSGHVISFLLNDDFIYFHEVKDDGTSKEYYFCKLDRNTNQTEIISKGFLQNVIIEVDGLKIYANSCGKLFWTDDTENVNYANGYNNYTSSSLTYHDLQSLGFYNNGKAGTVTTENQKVTITYGNTIVFFLEEVETVLYPCIYVANEKLYFSVYEFIENENCNNDWCICHYGKSIVYEYDFVNKGLIEKYETDIGEYIISFDSENVTYYSDGTVMRNGHKIQSVTPIKPFGEYVQWGAGFKVDTEIGLWIFYDDDTSLWCAHHDYSNIIKDEYF